jgi:hypothetical protein
LIKKIVDGRQLFQPAMFSSWPVMMTSGVFRSGAAADSPRVNLSQVELWTAIQEGLRGPGKSLHDCR